MRSRRRRRVTYRPSKQLSLMGGIFGGVFILLGIFMVIPTFGPFGILWTLFAVVITGVNLYQAFGKGYVGPEIHIEDEDGGESLETSPSPSAPAGSSAQERLTRLRGLYDQRLITQEEYEEKRQEIVKEL